MRLEKYLADCGIGSRSECKTYIKKNMVTVNGEVVKNGAMQITDSDCICYQGREVILHKNLYYMLHKPAGYVCATKDELHQTVLSFFPEEIAKHLIIVGRLDKDTEGLLLLTDDGNFSHKLTAPGKHVEKTYYFEATGILPKDAAIQIEKGLDIGDDTLTRPGKLSLIATDKETNTSKAYLTIHEGRYHQVKRMVKALGCEVTYLKRTAIGKLDLDDMLPLGHYRALTENELKSFGFEIESRK